MTLSTLSSNGRTTIPIEIRKFLGLESGHRIRYRVEDGKVILEAAGASTDALYGSLSAATPESGSEEVARVEYSRRKYAVKAE